MPEKENKNEENKNSPEESIKKSTTTELRSLYYNVLDSIRNSKVVTKLRNFFGLEEKENIETEKSESMFAERAETALRLHKEKKEKGKGDDKTIYDIIEEMSNSLGTNHMFLLKNNFDKIKTRDDLDEFCKKHKINVLQLQNFLEIKGKGVINDETFKKFKSVFYELIDKKFFVDRNTEQDKDIDPKFANLKNKEFIDALGLPENFNIIGNKFLNKLGNKTIGYNTPLALVDGKNKKMCYIYRGKIRYQPISIGKNGLTDHHIPGDRKTLKGAIHEFNPQISKKGRTPDSPCGNGPSRTIIGASLQSSLSNATGGKYFHGVGRGRETWGATHGCIGVNPVFIMKMYDDVIRAGGGYGYVDVA